MTAPAAEPSKGPRPFAAFLVSLAVSTVLLGVLLLSDRRVFELAEARARVRQLDAEIAERERQNRDLQAQVEAANKHEFPAERIAREELRMVGPSDLVILYPSGSLTAKPTPAVKSAEDKNQGSGVGVQGRTNSLDGHPD
jgi:cell division protein FtsB